MPVDGDLISPKTTNLAPSSSPLYLIFLLNKSSFPNISYNVRLLISHKNRFFPSPSQGLRFKMLNHPLPNKGDATDAATAER